MHPSDLPRYICGECGGSNVKVEAEIKWNFRKQEWEIVDIFDRDFCPDCNQQVYGHFNDEPQTYGED